MSARPRPHLAKADARKNQGLPHAEKSSARDILAPAFIRARGRTARAAVLDIGTGSGSRHRRCKSAAPSGPRRRYRPAGGDDRARKFAHQWRRFRIELGAVPAGVGTRRFRERYQLALVLANILLEPLQKLAAPVAALSCTGGRVVLSGILNAQAAAAVASYRARGLVLIQRIALGGWTTVVLVRPSRAKGANCPRRFESIDCRRCSRPDMIIRRTGASAP